MRTLGIFLTLAFVVAANAYCPRYYERRGRSNWCYRFVEPPAGRLFDGARTNCLHQGGDLLSVQDQYERNWIMDQVVKRNNTHNVRDWWTGLVKRNGVWTFSDGRNYNQNLAPWVPGEPKNNTRATCAKVTLTGMVAIVCGSNILGYICKRNINTPAPCPYNYEQGATHCYLMRQNNLPWNDAREYCRSDDAELVITEDLVVSRGVNDWAKYTQNNIWVGLRSIATSGSTVRWQWSNGTYADESKLFWGRDQPNVPQGQENTTCVEHTVAPIPRESLSAISCDESRYYMCGRPIGTCENGWRPHQGQCYRVVSMRRNFVSANNYCEVRGAKLLMIKSSKEQDFLNLLIPELHEQNFHFVWLGLSAEPNNQPWLWSDGTRLNTNPFRNWADGEPKRKPARKDCVIIFTGSKFSVWTTTHKCGMMQSFICQIPQGVLPIEPTTTPVPYYCDDDWQRMGGDRCVYYNATELSWPLARQSCKRQGGDLLKIRNAEDNDFVANNLDRDYYTGLHRRNNLGNFTWLDETVFPTFHNWAPGEPNDYDDMEACAVIINGPRDGDSRFGMWNDIWCNRRVPFICDKPAYIGGITPPATTPTIPNWTAKCGPGWEDHIGTDWCYMFESEFVSWRDGRGTCRDFGGELVSILSPDEQTYITGRVRDRLDVAMWIGINDLAEPKRWRWVDRSPLPYFAWAEGWPDGGATDSRHCGVFMLRTNKWESRECNSRFTFICKKRGDVPMPTDPPATTPRPGFEYRCIDGSTRWTEYENACYLFVKKQGQDWDTARYDCLRKKADLASIHSQDEMDFIMANVKESMVNVTARPTNGVWIGLQDFRGRHYYQWSDHSEVVYTNWERGEPNNWQGIQEHCTEMKVESGQWNDEICAKNANSARGWVCKHMKREQPILEITTPQPIVGCPNGTSHRYQRSCLRFVRDTFRTFDEARRDCQDWTDGGDLVDVTDKFTNAFLLTRLRKDDGRYWIGYSNRGNADGHWSWVNGAVSGTDYTNWGFQFTGNERESVASLITTGNQNHGMWRAESSGRRKYICKVGVAGMTTPPPTPTSSTPVCEEGWKEDGDNCYKEGYPSWGNDLMKHTWAEALFNCRRQGADLASIHSLEDNDFIRTRMDRQFHGDPKWWIGLHNNTATGQQEWSDGDGVSYTWWKDGQPDSHNGEENCVKFDYSDGGRWQYQNCNIVANWVCKKKKWDPPAPSITPPMPTEGPCSPELLIQKKQQSEGYHANCQHLGGGQGRTLQQCKTETCQLGGNTANFNGLDDGRCSVKKCFGGDLEYDRDHGGFDIFTLDGPSCDEEGWKFYNDACWFISKDEAGERDVSWQRAREICMEKGGELASLHSSQENAVISRLVSFQGQTHLWIGFNRLDLGAWKWTDNTPDDYINWARGEPNDHHYGQLCVNFYSFNGFWNDDNCADQAGFICKKAKGNMSPITTTPTVPVQGFCPGGFVGIANKCFTVVDEGNDKWVAWVDAVKACRDMGTGYDLASINSPMEQALVNVLLDGIGQRTWIGMSTRVGNRKQWVDNSPITYENWNAGEPNGQRECVEMYAETLLGLWNDDSCDQRLPYLCQYRKWLAGPIPTTVEPFPPGCRKEGYLDYLGQCYKLVSGAASWDDQVSGCRQDDGGDLASIHTWADNSFIKFFYRQTQGPIWIGLNDKEIRGTFTWSNNWFVNFTNWGPGQPVNDENKRCVSVQDDGGWTLTSCSDRYPAVCKISSESPPSPPPILPGKCPDGKWVDFHMGCYHVEDGDSDVFADAELECVNKGGNLISIHDQFENLFVLQRMKNQNIRQRLWLGMTRPLGNAGAWRWTDGSPLQYENWAPGEPSDPDGTEENCVEMIAESGRWNDITCSALNKIACKTDKEIFSTVGTTLPPVVLTTTQGTRRTRPGWGSTVYTGQPVPSTTPPPINSNTGRPTFLAPIKKGLSNDAKVGIAFGVLIGVMVIVLVVLVLNKRRDQLPSALRKAIMKDGTAGFSNSMYFSQESVDRPVGQTVSGSTGVQMQLPPAIDSTDATIPASVPTLEVSPSGDGNSSTK